MPEILILCRFQVVEFSTLELGPHSSNHLPAVFQAPTWMAHWSLFTVPNDFCSPKSQSLHSSNKQKGQARHNNTPVPESNFLSHCPVAMRSKARPRQLLLKKIMFSVI